MSPFTLVTWLGWACYLGAGGSLIAYVVQVTGARGWRRPWNAAGLVFTSVALSQTPFLFDAAMYGRGLRSAVVVTLCLIAAAALQAFTALRPRRRTDAAVAAGGQDA